MMEAVFIQYLKNEKRYSQHTILAYSKDIEDFKSFLSTQNVQSLIEVNPQFVRAYIVYKMEQGLEPSSVSRKLSSLRSLYRFGIKKSFIKMDPMRIVKAPKLSKRLPVFVEESKLVSLLDSEEVFPLDFEGRRDHLIIELLFGTGIRLSELLQLKLSDVDSFTGTIKVLGKRNKERIIPVPSTIGKAIDNFLKVRALENLELESDLLIVTNNGKSAYPALVYRTVKKYLTQISTQEKRSPHVLRHSYATSLLNKGADLNAIKDLLGHESLAATQVYVHNSIERLKSVYKQAHPKA